MNQYIITEEKLVKLQGYFHEQNLVKFFEIINEVFDHPYQSERDTCPQNKIWQHCPVAEQIRKQEREKVLDIVADIINNRITELREGKPEYYIRFGEKNTFNELQATEGEFLLLRIREELQQAGEP